MQENIKEFRKEKWGERWRGRQTSERERQMKTERVIKKKKKIKEIITKIFPNFMKYIYLPVNAAQQTPRG